MATLENKTVITVIVMTAHIPLPLKGSLSTI